MTRLFAPRYALDDLQQPMLPTPDTLPPHPSTGVESNNDSLIPVQNWSHPFRDKRDVLQQLTHLANAASGRYPLGSSGLWHGGVHFDAGTAGTLDQSIVHCIADGEVVAYRIDEQSPDTTYFVNKQPVSKPFSRNFVLVRHRLQPPAIKGSTDTPPSLIIYSLYMHLRDWAAYEKDSAVVRPGFWKSGSTLQVRVDVNDIHGDYPGQRGLNVRNKASKGAIIGWLPRGAEVQVSGEGTYRKLENTPGPDHLKDASGGLRGYVCTDFLRPLAGEQNRVVSETPLNVRAQPMVRKGNEIGTLYPGTEVTVGGTGRFRKLERVNQYVHFASLQSGAVEPEARGSVVVLDRPVAIKAGELIGHMGRYHEGAVDYPENRLHLEVFSAGDVKTFLRLSRLWADKLPASSRTWLKLVKGTRVIAHQGTFSSKKPPTLKGAGTPSAVQLLLPKTLLDGLPAERKIAVPASGDSKACNWYRLDGLLHDADNNLLDGWVREEVGVTPWLSPWSWEGYETLADYDSPRSMLASFMRASGRFKEDEVTRHGAAADKADQGPIKKRLFDIIDRNRDGKLSGSEIQAALRFPAHAQSISQLIVRYQSEWHHTPGKWDALDDLLGHGGSTPNLNWLAEKERIKAMSWWAEVAGRLGLPVDGKVHHLHPLGLLGWLCSEEPRNDLVVERGQVTFDAEGNDNPSSYYFSRQLHWPGGASGVTLGRGYDMRHRTKASVCADLMQAGLDVETSRKFSQGAELFSDAARDFVTANKAAYGVISTRSQRVLFETVVYPRYAIAAQQQYESVAAPGTPLWEDLDSRVRDIAVDLTYQQGSIWKRQLPHISANDKQRLANYIESTPELLRYERGRNRARYLRAGD